MKKIISILLSFILTVVIFGILDITKILVYNTLITYYISFVILLVMFLILFLKVFNTEKNNNNIPSVSSNVNTFNTIKKENTQPVSNNDISSQKANFDLSSGTSTPVQETLKPEYNAPPVHEPPKPDYNTPPVHETILQQEKKENLPYTDIFGNPSKPTQEPKPIEKTEVHDVPKQEPKPVEKTEVHDVPKQEPKPIEKTEVHDVPKQDLNITNFPKDKNKKKGFVPLSTFDKISKDEE